MNSARVAGGAPPAPLHARDLPRPAIAGLAREPRARGGGRAAVAGPHAARPRGAHAGEGEGSSRRQGEGGGRERWAARGQRRRPHGLRAVVAEGELHHRRTCISLLAYTDSIR